MDCLLRVDGRGLRRCELLRFEMPPKWETVFVTLFSGAGVLARWDGEQWWMAERPDIPIANQHVINWRTVN
jgi:hypothetical protein